LLPSWRIKICILDSLVRTSSLPSNAIIVDWIMASKFKQKVGGKRRKGLPPPARCFANVAVKNKQQRNKLNLMLCHWDI